MSYILCVGQVEDRANIDKQIAKQSVLPNAEFIYVDKSPATTIDGRRKRIAYNHLKLMSEVERIRPDLVWQVEGDCELPDNALEKLLEDYQQLKGDNFGYVSGIQVGRHGIKAIGAWHFNYHKTEFKSLNIHAKGIQRVDATGFYCLLAERETWLNGLCNWNGERWGPDVNFGLSLKDLGLKMYADMDIAVGHKTPHGDLYHTDLSACNVIFSNTDNKWSYKTT